MKNHNPSQNTNQNAYPSIRIFKNPILEWCTHVHPIVPLVFWGPFIGYLLFHVANEGLHSPLEFVVWALMGLLVWTFTEYTLHRFVFHMEGEHWLIKKFVFLFHGLHHDDPNDPTRLVMPPVPAVIIVFLLWQMYALFIPAKSLNLFMAFFLIGYLTYDYIHYATHHFKMNSPLGSFLRKYHLQHHHRKSPTQFGVSSPLWDYIFQTHK